MGNCRAAEFLFLQPADVDTQQFKDAVLENLDIGEIERRAKLQHSCGGACECLKATRAGNLLQ